MNYNRWIISTIALSLGVVALNCGVRAEGVAEEKALAPELPAYQAGSVPEAPSGAKVESGESLGKVLPLEVADIPGAPTYTMRDAMKMAMDNSPTLRASRAAYEQAKGATEEARTGGRPTVDFGASYIFTVPEAAANMGENRIVIGHQHNYGVNLTLSQVISTFGRLHYAVLASQMSEYSALEQYRQALESQLARTANNYLNALLAQEAVVIAAQQLDAQTSSLKQAEDLFAGGTVAKFDVLRVKAAKTSAELALIEAKNALRLAKANLCSDMGLPQGTEFNLHHFDWAKVPVDIGGVYDLESSINDALERRPEVKAAIWAKEAARARLEASRNNRNPTLALQSVVNNTQKTSMSSGTTWTTTLALQIPIYDGGEEKAQSKQLEAVVEQLDSNLENVRRGVRLDVEKCYYNLNSRWEAILQAESGLEQAQEAYRVAEVRYAAGLSTPTELLDSQTALVSAKRSLAVVKYNYLGANVDWMLATSGPFPFKVAGPIDKSDLKSDLEAWYVDPTVEENEPVELINPIKDKDIPEAVHE
ncbi:TolC family protein [bacterium]|nr:TolC family protein [bacterium]